ncbi:MAG: DinB family protein [Planctomycetota bacterium]
MFQREITINEFQLGHFKMVSKDIESDSIFTRSPGHRHTPAWILGHLAICGEMGQQMLGGTITHADWLERFGPGSVDAATPDESISLHYLINATVTAYSEFRTLAASPLDTASLALPHTVPFLIETPIRTNADLISLLLTNHFGFHLSQLSSCRRAAGLPPLF